MVEYGPEGGLEGSGGVLARLNGVGGLAAERDTPSSVSFAVQCLGVDGVSWDG